ncbi:MAG: hypothetical protein IJ540_04340 [Prevotella sp.]|nr:hypothetical protein [Prevotella sp.]
MDIDIKELIKAAAEGFDLSNFKGDVVGVKIVENEIGNVEEGGIGVQKVYGAIPQKATEGMSGKKKGGELPEWLASENAKKYWSRLQEADFVDADYQLKASTTRKQAMYIAELFAERIGIKSKWKTFEQLWGISNLAQEKWDMQETGTTPQRSKEIDQIFAD